MSNLPLEGIRVADFGIVWAGPYACMLLADMGAEVIRVESTRFAPYGTRGYILRPPDRLLKTGGLLQAGYPDREAGARPWNRSAQFNSNARNKMSMTVDHLTPRGKEIIKKLIQITDVVVENNAYGTMDKIGLGYEELRKVKEDLIFVSMPGYGNTGPYKERTALGRHLECIVGHTLLRGYRESDPTTTTDVYHADASAGIMAALAVLVALNHRQETGEGQFVDLAQGETIIPQLVEGFMDCGLNNRAETTLGNRHPSAAPCGVYPCSGDDRWIAITIFSDEEWRGLRRAMGDPAWTGDTRFATVASRYQNQDELDALLADWTRPQKDYDVMRLLQENGVPAGPLMDERDCFEDPHLAERGFFEEVTQADCGTHMYPGMQWKLSRTPLGVRLPPCRLGEHNEYVYKQLLKVSDEEYRELEREGHIGMDYHPSIIHFGRAKL